MRKTHPIRLAALTLCLALVATESASAITVEQIRDQCRATVGRPIVRSCMQGGIADRDICVASARPQIRRCVMAKISRVGVGAITFTAQAKARRLEFWCKRNLRPYRTNVSFALREARGCFASSRL